MHSIYCVLQLGFLTRATVKKWEVKAIEEEGGKEENLFPDTILFQCYEIVMKKLKECT